MFSAASRRGLIEALVNDVEQVLTRYVFRGESPRPH